jgi:hypothetical protein
VATDLFSLNDMMMLPLGAMRPMVTSSGGEGGLKLQCRLVGSVNIRGLAQTRASRYGIFQ